MKRLLLSMLLAALTITACSVSGKRQATFTSTMPPNHGNLPWVTQLIEYDRGAIYVVHAKGLDYMIVHSAGNGDIEIVNLTMDSVCMAPPDPKGFQP